MPQGEWLQARIGDLGRVVTGATPRAAEDDAWGDEVDFITPRDQRPGYRGATARRRLSAAGAARLAVRLLPAGSTCVTCIGETIGKTSLTTRPAVTNQQINSVIPDPGAVRAPFLYYLLTACGPRLAQAASGSAARIVNKRQFERFWVLVPPLAEQDRVVRILGALDDKVVANAKAAATALDLADALLDQALASGQATSCRLGDLADLRYGRALPAAIRRPGTVPVYGSAGVVGSHDLPLVAGPGIVIGRKGAVGTVHWSQRDFWPIDTVFYVRPAGGAVPLELLFLALRRIGLPSLRGDSAVPGLTRSSVTTSDIRLPPKSALGDLAEAAGRLLALRASLAAESAQLMSLRDTLLAGLVRAGGNLSVSNEALVPLDQRGLH
ncbi:MAG TPA: restriction endonuclease subunit S [Trebonia sp.]|nr:restriction endonuclease subunit S [Trebonia sp.]